MVLNLLLNSISYHSYLKNATQSMNREANLYAEKCDNIRESHNSLIQTVISKTANFGNQQESTDDRTG